MSPRKSLAPEERKSYRGRKIPKFCQNILARRAELGITQERLAEMIGATKPRISELEGGKLPRDEERIIALADALDVTIDWLFRNEPDAK